MTRTRCWQAALLVLAGCVTLTARAPAQEYPDATKPTAAPDSSDALPPELRGMQVVEKLNEKIPPDLELIDQDGRKVRLGDYFDGRRPVILNLGYFRCPMLCGLVLNALTSSIKELDWTAGDQFRILTVSFDPLETPDLAKLKRQNYLAEYGRPAAAAGWDFLTGRSQPIRQLLDATGFPARWVESKRQYVHPACLIVLTPDGRISRYLYGVFFEPKTLRLSLVEASEGKIGTTVDHILLYCFHYDPAGGRYTVAAMNLARVGGLLTLAVLGGFLTLLWRRERRRGLPASVSVGDHSEVHPTG